MFAVRLAVLLLACALPAVAQDRETKVRGDRDQFQKDGRWIYNDFARATKEAEQSGKPLLVVMRCIPCEACSKFDKEIIAGEETLNDLLDKFVCVRIVQGNGLDLALFQFDYDQSFHALLMNADQTIYGRFGTRSDRPEHEDMTVEGLRATLAGGLALHAAYPANRAALAGKTGGKPLFAKPEEFPALKGKYTSQLDYEGKVVQSCIHCHQIRDAERTFYRAKNEPLPDRVLFPYPLPDVLGMKLDGKHRARIASVQPESAASAAQLQAGDELLELAGQPLLSPADVQWVLHQAADEGTLAVRYLRDGKEGETTLQLAKGWRRTGDLAWRPTTWELRALATGGLRLESLTAEELAAAGLSPDKLALRVKNAGQYGRHSLAKENGFQKGDVLITVAGSDRPHTETSLIAQLIDLPIGSRVPATVIRGGKNLELKIPTQ